MFAYDDVIGFGLFETGVVYLIVETDEGLAEAKVVVEIFGAFLLKGFVEPCAEGKGVGFFVDDVIAIQGFKLDEFKFLLYQRQEEDADDEQNE